MTKETHSTDAVQHCPHSSRISPVRDPRFWVEIAGMLLLVLVAGSFLGRLGYSPTIAIGNTALGIGAIFLMGLVASSTSCLALVGGLLLSVSAEWSVTHRSSSALDRLRPLLVFNAGRLIGYFLFGGLFGLLGSVLTLSTRSTGIITILIALVMFFLGLDILGLFPRALACTIPFPRSFTSRIRKLSKNGGVFFAMGLGALTFFVPCGFTQSMQLLALGSGSFLQGAVIMVVFALGTLPALLGVSIVSSFAHGTWGRLFLRFSGVLVLVLGLLNIRSGLLLTGIDIEGAFAGGSFHSAGVANQDPYVKVDEQNRQIITVYVSDKGYSPNSFTIAPGLTTWIYAIAKEPISGCANFLLSPTHNLRTAVKQGTNWLGPIISPQNDFVLTCSMGMLRADVHVAR